MIIEYKNVELQTKGSSVVYWIHTPNQANITTQGYVGITKNDVKARFTAHKGAIRNNRKNNQIYKTLANEQHLIFEVVLIADNRDYCHYIERLLRPNANIGWNVAPGGRDGSTQLGGEIMRQRWLKINTPCDRWFKQEMTLLKKLHRDNKKKIAKLFKQEHYPNRWQSRKQPRKGSMLGMTGANYYPKYNLYRSQIMIDGKHATLGYYKTKEEAHEKYLIAKSLITKFRESQATTKWLIKQVNAIQTTV